MLLDIARASERDGIDAWFDIGRWLQGKLEIAPQAAPLYGDIVARVLAAQRGLSKKCLVLDLDNTLWGGVIGDDGLDGIVLGEGSAAGEAHLALAALCQAAQGARDHFGRLLQERCAESPKQRFAIIPKWSFAASDIAAFRGELGRQGGKPQGHRRAAQHRARQPRLRRRQPGGAGARSARACRWSRCRSCPRTLRTMCVASPTRVISRRSHLPRRIGTAPGNTPQTPNARLCLDPRKAWTNSSAASKCRLVFGPFTPVDHDRIVQLINKTNQFNTTTRRYSCEEIEAYRQPADALTLQFRLIDRIGDNGLVSTMILRPTPDCEDVLEIENWVMSCRVFGRQLEFAAMNIAVEAARRGARGHLSRIIFPRQEQRDQHALSAPRLYRSRSTARQRAERRAGFSTSRITSCGTLTSLCTEQQDDGARESLGEFTRILRDLLLDELDQLTMETRREDVPNWDSFNYHQFHRRGRRLSSG